MEHPLNHSLQTTMPIVFLAVWVVDSFIVKFSTFLAERIFLPVRLGLAFVTLLIAFLLIARSHQGVFPKSADTPVMVDTGVYGRVRHPMYLGSLLVYVAFIFVTLSLLSLGLWVGVFLVYDRLATFEEENLLRILGDQYEGYRRRVRKWLPLKS